MHAVQYAVNVSSIAVVGYPVPVRVGSGTGFRPQVRRCEKKLGSDSRWSRWQGEILQHATQVRRTARSRSLGLRKVTRKEATQRRVARVVRWRFGAI